METTTNTTSNQNQPTYVALAILVLALLIGAYVYFANYRSPRSDLVSTTSTTTTTTTNTNSTTNGEVTNPGTSAANEVSPFPGGYLYKNTSFGITVPLTSEYVGYAVAQDRSNYAGVSNTASLHFSAAGAERFTINVFTKEQWNDIRIQETNGQVNSFGEGRYIGENFNYIFSVILNSNRVDDASIIDRIRFY